MTKVKDPGKHLFAEKGGPYNLRCIYCDVSSIDPKAELPCPKAPEEYDVS